MKQKILQVILTIAVRLFGLERWEKMLVFGCRHGLLRKCFRLGAFAYEFPEYLAKNTSSDDCIRLAQVRGYRLYVSLLEPPGVASYFFGHADTYPFLPLLLRDGDTVIDAGANRGQYTCLAASLVGETGRVFAFEPNPAVAALLTQSVAANQWQARVVVEQRALWKQRVPRMKFHLSTNPRRSGTSSLVFHGYDIRKDHYIEVDATTLDSYFTEQQIDRCRFLKIDVERAECQLLEGLVESLRQQRIDVILIEMYRRSPSYTLLSTHGYQGFWVRKQVGMTACDQVTENSWGDFLFLSPRAYEEMAPNLPVIEAQLMR